MGDRVFDKKYSLVPPDGGWGYMICLSITIIYSSTTMFMTCFGMIFDELLKKLNMDSTSINLMSGVGVMSLSSAGSCIAWSKAFWDLQPQPLQKQLRLSGLCDMAVIGFVTGPLLKLMSKRKLALLGSLLFNLGVFATVFVNTKLLFFICQGILQSFGVGLLYNLASTIQNEYFVEKRLFCISIAQSVTAFATMFAPQIVKWASDLYGYEGCLLIISAIGLQTFVAVAMLQPVQWHMKKVEKIDTEENKQFLSASKPVTGKGIVIKISEANDPDTDVSEQVAVGIEKKNIKDIIKGVFDVSGLRSFMLSSAFLGSTIAVFSDFTFSLMLPQALYSMRWSDATVSWAISLTGLGDLITRFSFIFLNKWLSKFGIQEIYIISLLIAFAARLCMLCSENKMSVLVFITLIGVARCSIMILPPLIIADVVTPEKFTTAMGLYMLLTGVLSLVFGPAIGAVRDLTESYPTVFYILSSSFAIVAMFWIIELCYKKNKHKRVKLSIERSKLKNLKK